MAAQTIFVTYACFFSTPEKADYAISLLNGHDSVDMKPQDAAALFDFPWPPVGGPRPLDGILGPLFPFNIGSFIPNPNASTVVLDGEHDSYTVPGQVVGNGFPNSDTLIVRWSMSVIVLGPEYDGADPLIYAAIPPRRWAMGWEGFTDMELHPNAGVGNRCRDASRVVDGMGLKFRGEATTSGVVECALVNSEGTGLPTKKSWERIYIRLRNLGGITGDIWRCSGSAATNSGARLRVNTDGSLTAFNVNGSGVNDITFGTTSPLELDTWYKIDILVEFNNGVTFGAISVYVNGFRIIFANNLAGGTGLGQVQNHRSTILMTFAVTSTWEIDIDDWHNAEFPSIGGVTVLNSLDFMIGTHVKASFIPIATGTAVNWLTNGAAVIIQALNQYINPNAAGLNQTSSTGLATIDAPTDLLDFTNVGEQENVGVNLGPAMVTVSISAAQTGADNGRLGYRVAGGAPVLTTIALPTIVGFNGTETYLPSGSLDFYPIQPFSVVYEKGPAAVSATVLSLAAFCQYIGIWGLQDLRSDNPEGSFIPGPILHNCRYPRTPWAGKSPVPYAPVCVTNWSYTGNGTVQDILGPSGVGHQPFQILVIRNVSTANIPPMVVLSTMMAPEQSSVTQGLAGDIPIIALNTGGLAYFRVVGTNPRINQLGQIYEYFLFSDPAIRFSLMGEFNHGVQTISYNNPLMDGEFQPDFGMFFAGVASSGSGFWLKGPSHTGLEVSTINGTTVNNAVQFGLGNLVTAGGITQQNNATAYGLFRKIDGSGLVMIQVTNYVGNGSASRVISLTPVSGRFPIVAFVTRRGGAQGTIYRDARHGVGSSIQMSNGANTATGIITGGIDSITVGLTLNAVGGEYDVLVFPGTSSGWVEGTYCGPAGAAPGDFWEDDPEPLPPNVGGIFEGGLILGGTPSLSLFKNLSGIYTLTPGKHTDTLYDRQTAQPSVEVAIPDPNFKTGYIGG